MMRTLFRLLLLLPLPAWPVAPPPPTFTTVIGSALLCHDHVDAGYFYRYLEQFAGAPLKHEGGAWWFQMQPGTQLWGVQVNEIFVSDDSSEYDFIGASVTDPPDTLAKKLDVTKVQAGWKFVPGAGKYPIREAPTGARIIYERDSSRLYCARYVGARRR